MIELFVLDEDLKFCKKLINNISEKNKNVRVSFITDNIKDILTMPNIDILIANFSYRKEIEKYEIATSNIIYVSDEDNIKIGTLTAIYKYNIDLIRKKINSISNKISDTQLENLIYDEIRFLDFNFSHIGTSCISESIKLLCKTDKNYNDQNLEKDIYPLVGKKFNISSATVKGNINYATTKMLDECDKSRLCKYLGYNLSNRPGAKTIMCAVVKNLKSQE